ncbi:MAG: methyltransferase, partial [Nitrospirae bacterium]
MENLIKPEIEAYAEGHSTAETDACRLLREETYRTMEIPHM